MGKIKDKIEMDNDTITFWNNMFGKMGLLLDAMLEVKGEEMDMDDKEYRWVSDRIEYWNTDDRPLSKGEMETANNLWNVYGRY